MANKDKAKFVRELKNLLNLSFNTPYAVAQVHLVQDCIVVDINVRHRNLGTTQRMNLTYHEKYAMPEELTYGCARVYADMIKDSYNAFLSIAILPKL